MIPKITPTDDNVYHVLSVLEELQKDTSLPKNVKSKLERITWILNENHDFCIRINKALDQFEDIVEDINLKPHTRAQIWNVVSILESFGSKE